MLFTLLHLHRLPSVIPFLFLFSLRLGFALLYRNFLLDCWLLLFGDLLLGLRVGIDECRNCLFLGSLFLGHGLRSLRLLARGSGSAQLNHWLLGRLGLPLLWLLGRLLRRRQGLSFGRLLHLLGALVFEGVGEGNEATVLFRFFGFRVSLHGSGVGKHAN